MKFIHLLSFVENFLFCMTVTITTKKSREFFYFQAISQSKFRIGVGGKEDLIITPITSDIQKDSQKENVLCDENLKCPIYLKEENAFISFYKEAIYYLDKNDKQNKYEVPHFTALQMAYDGDILSILGSNNEGNFIYSLDIKNNNHQLLPVELGQSNGIIVVGVDLFFLKTIQSEDKETKINITIYNSPLSTSTDNNFFLSTLKLEYNGFLQSQYFKNDEDFTIITCGIGENNYNVSCFSGKFNQGKNSYSKEEEKNFLRNCKGYFSFQKINDKYGMIGCGYTSLLMQVISSNLEESGGVFQVKDTYTFIDFSIFYKENEAKLFVCYIEEEHENQETTFSYNVLINNYIFVYLEQNEKYNIKEIIPFYNLEEKKITFTEIGSNVYEKEEIIKTNNEYPIDGLSITETSQKVVEFSYKVPSLSKEIKFSLSVCHPSCDKCIQAKDGGDGCQTCREGKFLEEGKSNCLEKNTDGYYYDENYMKKCPNSCQKCAKEGEKPKPICSLCEGELIFVAEKPDTKDYIDCAIKENKSGHYIFVVDGKEVFYPCLSEGCKECSREKEDTVDTCSECKNDFFRYEKNTFDCFTEDSRPSHTYFDKEKKAIFDCFSSCDSCDDGGDRNRNNCTKCFENYAFIETSDTNCIRKGSQPSSYYLDVDKNMYKKCYNRCERCEKGGEEAIHNCLICKEGFEITSGNKNRNCLDLKKEVNPDQNSLNDFLPIGSLVTEYETKRLNISKGFLYYYTSETIFKKSEVSYISLEKFENDIKKDLSTDDKIFIGQIFTDDPFVFDYSIFSSSGQVIDISHYKSEITVHYPISRLSLNESILIKILAEYPNKELDIYSLDSDFYNDYCSTIKIDGVDISVNARQNIFLNELTFCPEGCKYKDYSKTTWTVACYCSPTVKIGNVTSGEGVFKGRALSAMGIFKCVDLYLKYPNKDSYLHWIPSAHFAITLFLLYFVVKKLSDLKKKLLLEIGSSESKEIEMVNFEKNQSVRKNTRSYSSKSSFSSKSLNESLTIQNTLNSNFDYSKKTVGYFFEDLIKRKLFLVSIITYRNYLYSSFCRFLIHLSGIVYFIFINALVITESSDILNEKFLKNLWRIFLNSFISFCLGFLILKIFDIALTIELTEEKKKYKYSLIVNSVVISLCIFVDLLSSYYLFVFGLLKTKSQRDVLILSAIDIAFTFIYQIVICSIVAVFWSFGTILNVNCFIVFGKILNLII